MHHDKALFITPSSDFLIYLPLQPSPAASNALISIFCIIFYPLKTCPFLKSRSPFPEQHKMKFAFGIFYPEIRKTCKVDPYLFGENCVFGNGFSVPEYQRSFLCRIFARLDRSVLCHSALERYK